MAKDDSHRTRALVNDRGDEFLLSQDPVLFRYCGRIQEEVHRFAIEYHLSLHNRNSIGQFGGTLHEYIGKKQALELMEYVDEINVANGGEGTHLYSTGATPIKKLCLENDLHLLDASVRHLGTDKNLVVLEHLYNRLKDRMDIYFDTPVQSVERTDGGYRVVTDKGSYDGRYCVISVGRSGSKWMEQVCRELDIATKSNRVDIGVRVELPYEVFAHLTDELYESKIVYRTEKFQDRVRTFCMNPKGAVVTENTNGIVTVNGHSYEDPAKQTENTNFALLVSKHFTEPFKDSNGYGESIARLSNMLGGGVIIQRFGDLIRGQRSTPKRIEESFVTPTLSATPGDLSNISGMTVGDDDHNKLWICAAAGGHIEKRFQDLQPSADTCVRIFGLMIDVCGSILSRFMPQTYWQQWAMCIAGIVLLALGVTMEVTAKLVTAAGEGVVLAICRVLPVKFGNTKVAFDVTLVVMSIALSAAVLGTIDGVGLGTVASALCVGFISKQFSKTDEKIEQKAIRMRWMESAAILQLNRDT